METLKIEGKLNHTNISGLIAYPKKILEGGMVQICGFLPYRPYDTTYALTQLAFSAEDGAMYLWLEAWGELDLLIVWNPENLTIDEKGFVIEKATKVEWKGKTYQLEGENAFFIGN